MLQTRFTLAVSSVSRWLERMHGSVTPLCRKTWMLEDWRHPPCLLAPVELIQWCKLNKNPWVTLRSLWTRLVLFQMVQSTVIPRQTPLTRTYTVSTGLHRPLPRSFKTLFGALSGNTLCCASVKSNGCSTCTWPAFLQDTAGSATSQTACSRTRSSTATANRS